MDSDRVVGGLAGLAALCAIGVVGVFVGVCAAWVSRGVWRVGGAAVPWGLLVALAGSVSFVALVRLLRRAAGLAAVASWFAGVVALLVRGDTIVAGDALGIAFLVVVTTAVVLTAIVGGVGA